MKNLKKKINSNTRLVILSHIGGIAPEKMNLREITKKYPKIRFIEDCSQSHGGYVKKKAIGTFGDISCFSTMYRKNLVSNGTGGIIFTKKKNIMI